MVDTNVRSFCCVLVSALAFAPADLIITRYFFAEGCFGPARIAAIRPRPGQDAGSWCKSAIIARTRSIVTAGYIVDIRSAIEDANTGARSTDNPGSPSHMHVGRTCRPHHKKGDHTKRG